MGAIETEKKKVSNGEGSTADTNVDLKAFQPKDVKTLNQSMQSMLKFKAAKESFSEEFKSLKDGTQSGQPPLRKDDFVRYIDQTNSDGVWGRSFQDLIKAMGAEKERSKRKE